MSIVYDVDYFIAKFEAIPREKWITHFFWRDSDNCGCALGHCGWRINLADRYNRQTHSPVTAEGHALRALLPEIMEINDGDGEYSELGNHPRDRVLQALYDVKLKQKAIAAELAGEAPEVAASDTE